MSKGSIEQLKSGKYRVAVYAGKDPITGRKTYLKETADSEPEAQKVRERLLAQVDAERLPDKQATVSVLLDRWMEVADHELTTRETNEGYIRRTLKPALGDMPLRKLQHRVDILDRLYTHLRRCNLLCDGQPFVEHRNARGRLLVGEEHDCAKGKCRPHRCQGMSPGAIRRVHAMISAALNYAVSWGWIERNPAAFAHPPKLPKRRAQPPDPDSVARLINRAWEVDSEFALYLWLAVTTGARRGELAGLRWEYCFLDRGELLVDDNYVVRKGERRLKGTKTEEGRRLSLDSLSVQLLTDFRRERERLVAGVGVRLSGDCFVFSPDPACLRPWHPDHFTHAYGELAAELGIQTPLKNLRHFNATQLLSSGVDLRTTAGRLGHSDGGATTLRVYAAWVRPADQRAVNMLADDLNDLRKKAKETDYSVGKSPVAPIPIRQPARSVKPLEEYLSSAGISVASASSPYQQIAEQLRDAISAQTLVAGDVVGTVTEFAAWYGVSVGTVQRAMTMLAEDGVLVVRRGARSIVADRSGGPGWSEALAG